MHQFVRQLLPPRLLPALVLLATVCGCALKPTAVTSKEGGPAGQQSETAFVINRVGNAAVITVTFNDGSEQAAIEYTPTTRQASKGASHLGWSHSSDYGQSWTYGGRVATTNAWPILWGDPGITHSARDQRYVYIANLAVPKAKLDTAPGGVIDGPVNNYIGGACIARSTDAGKNFALYQCVQTTETDATGDFYDGGNMVSDADGNIYAAWVNVDTGAAHIWRAVGENGAFQKLSNPFTDGPYVIASHPRMRVNPDNGELFVMALNQTGELLIARRSGSSWSATWKTGMYTHGYVCVSSTGGNCSTVDTVVRNGPQFSFDIGSFGRDNDHVRMMFTRRSPLNGRLYTAGAGCMLNDQSCGYIAGWGTGEGDKDKQRSSYNPLVRSYRSSEMASKGEASLWMGSHATFRPETGRVTFGMGGLGIVKDINNDDLYVHLVIYTLADRVLCADLRGYRGDYDDLQALGPVPGREVTVFARTYTDSQPGCGSRWQFTSTPVHVGFTGN